MGKRKPSCLSCFGSQKEREIYYCKDVQVRIHAYGTKSGPIFKMNHAFLVDKKVITFVERKYKKLGESNFEVTISDKKDTKYEESSVKLIGKSSETVKSIAFKLSHMCSGNRFDMSDTFYLITGTNVESLIELFKSETQDFPGAQIEGSVETSNSGDGGSTSILGLVTLTNVIPKKTLQYSRVGLGHDNNGSEMFTIGEHDDPEPEAEQKPPEITEQQQLIDETTNVDLQ